MVEYSSGGDLSATRRTRNDFCVSVGGHPRAFAQMSLPQLETRDACNELGEGCRNELRPSHSSYYYTP